MLEAGISSSYRIASFFGLTQAVRVIPERVGTLTVDAEKDATAVPDAALNDALLEEFTPEELAVPAAAAPEAATRPGLIARALKAVGLR